MSDPRQGRSLALCFVDGTPDGLVTAAMVNRTGPVPMVPRLRLAEAPKRREAADAGMAPPMGGMDARAGAAVLTGKDRGAARPDAVTGAVAA